eukprot:3259907-Pyramimonas_sp.AAC.1
MYGKYVENVVALDINVSEDLEFKQTIKNGLIINNVGSRVTGAREVFEENLSVNATNMPAQDSPPAGFSSPLSPPSAEALNALRVAKLPPILLVRDSVSCQNVAALGSASPPTDMAPTPCPPTHREAKGDSWASSRQASRNI